MRRLLGGMIILLILCASCAGIPRATLDLQQSDVFGILLNSTVDHREIKGVAGNDEPCLKGFERRFDPLDIVIGYRRDGSIRKLTTRNTGTSLFAIHPGDSLASAQSKAREAGFGEIGSPFRFQNGKLLLNLLSDKADSIFGITIESVEE